MGLSVSIPRNLILGFDFDNWSSNSLVSKSTYTRISSVSYLSSSSFSIEQIAIVYRILPKEKKNTQESPKHNEKRKIYTENWKYYKEALINPLKKT